MQVFNPELGYRSSKDNQLQAVINSAIAEDLEGVESFSRYCSELEAIEAIEASVNQEISYKLIYR